MHKKIIIPIFLVILIALSLSFFTPYNIIWVQDPGKDFHTTNFDPTQYGDGLYPIHVLYGDKYNSPDGKTSGDYRKGYVNQNGEWIIQPIYNYVEPFSSGLARVQASSLNGSEWYEDQVINLKGIPQPVFQNLFLQNIYCQKIEGNFLLCAKITHTTNGTPIWRMGLYNSTGSIIIPPISIYQKLNLPQENYCLAQDINGNYGFLDTTGKLIVPLRYELAFDFSEQLAAIKENGLWGFINSNGTMQITPTYAEVMSFQEGVAAVNQNGNWGFINKTNQFVIPAQYEKVRSFSEGVSAVQQNGKWGCINKKGEIVIPCKYEEVQSCSENRIRVKQNNRYGYFDKTGNLIINFLYGAALDFHNGVAIISTGDFSNLNPKNFPVNSYWSVANGQTTTYQNNLFGAINQYGQQILPFNYICISDFNDNTAILQRAHDNKIGIVHLKSSY